MDEPDPLVLFKVTHVAAVLAVQEHPAAAVTLTLPVALLPPNDCVVGEMPYVHAAAAWVTVTVRPAIVAVPVRVVVPVFATAASVTVPLPLPLVVPTLIQATLLAAVQEQPAPDVTVIVVVPPAAATLAVVGATVYAQAPSCVTVKVSAAMVSEAVRDAVLVFAATVNVTGAEPLPLTVPRVTQAAPLNAVQLQPFGAVSPTDPLPPEASNAWLVAASE